MKKLLHLRNLLENLLKIKKYHLGDCYRRIPVLVNKYHKIDIVMFLQSVVTL